jgi:penicillin-binding protein 2
MIDRTSTTDRSKAITRRAVTLGSMKAALFVVLAGRMYYLQVIEGEQYHMLAEQNRINIRLLAPPRGLIRDRFGVEMATNRQNLRVVLIPEQADDVNTTLDGLAKLVPLSEVTRTRLLREIRRTRGYIPVSVAENLTWTQFSAVNLNTPDLSGVQPEIGETRHYPFGPIAAHTVGYVTPVPEGQSDEDPLLQLPGFRIGKSGLEKTFDLKLRGKAGNSRVEVDAFGRSIRELARQDGDLGAELVLTLDMELQKYATERLGEESGAAIVMDVQTGDILAMASTPAFDPNTFNVGLTNAQWNAYLHHDHKPLTNKTISGLYAPGSTYKLSVALAGLECGAIDTNFQVFCGGKKQLGNVTFHCWQKNGHGTVDLHGALKGSCDVYFYEAALRIGIDRMAEMAKRLGYGEPLNIGLADEKAGVVPTRAWKKAVHNAPLTQGDALNAGIGQGFVLVTPLQLATMTARVANGVKAVRPRLVRSIGGRPVQYEEPPDLGISPASIAEVQAGAYAVANEPGGTALKVRLDLPGNPKMCSKTGTAQVKHLKDGDKRTQEELPWHLRNNALFICWAPHDAPRYAVAIVLEHGMKGSQYAGPIGGDILRQAMIRDPLRMAAYDPPVPQGPKKA